MIKTLNVDGENFTFSCRSRSTRYGFAHDCEMLTPDGYTIETCCHYVNRTWESYQYQSVMTRAVYELIEKLKDSIVRSYKHSNNRKHLSLSEKEALWNESKAVAKLRKLLTLI